MYHLVLPSGSEIVVKLSTCCHVPTVESRLKWSLHENFKQIELFGVQPMSLGTPKHATVHKKVEMYYLKPTGKKQAARCEASSVL